jgi:hypothetical protein
MSNMANENAGLFALVIITSCKMNPKIFTRKGTIEWGLIFLYNHVMLYTLPNGYMIHRKITLVKTVPCLFLTVSSLDNSVEFIFSAKRFCSRNNLIMAVMEQKIAIIFIKNINA